MRKSGNLFNLTRLGPLSIGDDVIGMLYHDQRAKKKASNGFEFSYSYFDFLLGIIQ